MLAPNWRSLAKQVRRVPERVAHPWRRRSAVRRLAGTPPPWSILFVCHGNICRSPYAAAVARRELPPTVTVASAGFIGMDRPSPPEAVATAAERGSDLIPHRSRPISRDALRDSTLIIVMDAEQRRRLLSAEWTVTLPVILLGDLDPEPITERTIPDPVDQPVGAFRSCYERIDRCMGTLIGLWREHADNQAHG